LHSNKLGSFLPSIASILKTKPVTQFFFFYKKYLYYTEEETGKLRKILRNSFFLHVRKKWKFQDWTNSTPPFPVSSSVCNKKTLIKKVWGHGISF